MRDRWLLPCVVVAACFMPVGVRGDEPRPSAAQIDRLIRQLGSEVFSEREEASRQLKKIGPAAMPALARPSRARTPRWAAAPPTSRLSSRTRWNNWSSTIAPSAYRCRPRMPSWCTVNGFNSGTVSQLAFQLKPATAKEGPVILQGRTSGNHPGCGRLRKLIPEAGNCQGIVARR